MICICANTGRPVPRSPLGEALANKHTFSLRWCEFCDWRIRAPFYSIMDVVRWFEWDW